MCENCGLYLSGLSDQPPAVPRMAGWRRGLLGWGVGLPLLKVGNSWENWAGWSPYPCHHLLVWYFHFSHSTTCVVSLSPRCDLRFSDI